MQDRVQTPQEAIVYWTEYVIRHKGAHHLRVAALDLYWYQYLMLDVIAFLILCPMALIILIRTILRKYKKRVEKLKKN